MTYRDSEDSDHQGFIPNLVEIDRQRVERMDLESTKLREFEARYIFGGTMLRKEPHEAYLTFKDIPKHPATINIAALKKKVLKEQLPTASRLYGDKRDYSLVYSRGREPFSSGAKAAFQHEVKLKSFNNNRELSYRTLRQWQGEKIAREEENIENNLIIESKFESGNLQCAFKSLKQPNTYVLFMQNDTNTYGYNQWFYFSIRNAKINTKYTFKVANFKKSYSFFNKGLQPVVFSLKEAQKAGNGWYRDGTNLSYTKSNFRQDDCGSYYTLEFDITFIHEGDYITLSSGPPYSYSRLAYNLKLYQKLAIQRQLLWRANSISNSLGNNQVPYITLSRNTQNINSKPNIVILARQHSGQTWSSYLVESLLDELLKEQHPASEWMLDNYNFRIFPMINVDGVIYGNFRCDIAGYDLNRCWKNPSLAIHPQIFHIKRQLVKLSEATGIQLCLDLHTHSKQMGLFAYCCIETQSCRAIPIILSKINPLFRLPACTFGISPDKEHTARAAVYDMAGNINTLTIEISSFGFKNKSSKVGQGFTPFHIDSIGKAIIQGYYSYQTGEQIIPISQSIFSCTVDKEIQLFLPDDSNEDQPISGSDSQPEIDQIDLELKLDKIFPSSFLEDHFVRNKRKTKKKKIGHRLKKMAKDFSSVVVEQKELLKTRKVQVENRMKSKTEIAHKQESRSFQALQMPKFCSSPSPSPVKRATLYPTPQQFIQNHNRKFRQPVQKNLKIDIDRPTKPLNLIEFSLKKLPIFASQKIPQAYNMLIDQTDQMTTTVGFTKKQIQRQKSINHESGLKTRGKDNNNKGINFIKQKQKNIQDDLPYLCIMSQNKRQMQLQKLKQRKEHKLDTNKTQTKNYTSVDRNQKNCTVLGRFIKDKNRRNIEMFSKIWMDNYSRYGDSLKGHEV